GIRPGKSGHLTDCFVSHSLIVCNTAECRRLFDLIEPGVFPAPGTHFAPKISITAARTNPNQPCFWRVYRYGHGANDVDRAAELRHAMDLDTCGNRPCRAGRLYRDT